MFSAEFFWTIASDRCRDGGNQFSMLSKGADFVADCLRDLDSDGQLTLKGILRLVDRLSESPADQLTSILDLSPQDRLSPGATVFLPFLPMLPTQILLNNFLYDLAQVTIPTDNVDPIYIRKPQHWNIAIIRNFMLIIGPISSIYDFLTFYFLLHFFHATEVLFHTGWFVESLATQTLVLFVIRTAKTPWTNRPSMPLAVTTLVCVTIGTLLPFSRFANGLGFTPLPGAYFVFLVFATATYLLLVEVVKRKLMGKLLREGSAQRAVARGTSLTPTASLNDGAEGTTEQLRSTSSEKNETVATK